MAMQPSTKTLLILAAIASAAAVSNGAGAQTAAIRAGDELRTLSVTPTDIADGKRVAETNCAGCHGANGISVTQGIPHLAGQRPAYLYIELKAYQSGNRGDSTMANVAKGLNDDALVKVAAYFAGLDPAPALTAPAGPAKPDAVQAGKTLAAAGCAGCHGNAGVTQIPATPSLV